MAIAQPQRVKDLSKGSQHICKQGHMRGGFVDKQAIRDLDARVDRDIEQGNTALASRIADKSYEISVIRRDNFCIIRSMGCPSYRATGGE
jgi:hypothetical protein